MMADAIVDAITELNEAKVMKLVRRELKTGRDPVELLERVHEGMKQVGSRYEAGTYFIADLIMSGLIFNSIMEEIRFPAESAAEFADLAVVFATVEQDIHDVGKNVTINYLKSRGINIIDLGVDVPAARIIDAVEKSGAAVLCLSGLITASYKSMKKTIDLLKKKHLPQKVTVIIGGNVDENVREYVGADYWTTDFTQALRIFKAVAGNHQADNNI